MADTNQPLNPTVLLSQPEIDTVLSRLAEEIAPHIDDDTVAVVLLTGGLWFAADMTRALYRAGRNVRFDALWMASYGDEKASKGQVEIRADLQRSVDGKTVLILDDVFDTGLSLAEAVRYIKAKGAAKVLTCVFARKPWPEPRTQTPNFVGWEAPARFLVGYGLDHKGHMRGLPDICALD